ncbi:hypothetical protein Scep_025723 [Stephania cephalantha]|uniref:Uncharacterized protein n=1 Tax=Stephania cephalantha TaxID=152367 RepID=A0AAP0ESN6_9MAGN
MKRGPAGQVMQESHQSVTQHDSGSSCLEMHVFAFSKIAAHLARAFLHSCLPRAFLLIEKLLPRVDVQLVQPLHAFLHSHQQLMISLVMHVSAVSQIDAIALVRFSSSSAATRHLLVCPEASSTSSLSNDLPPRHASAAASPNP